MQICGGVASPIDFGALTCMQHSIIVCFSSYLRDCNNRMGFDGGRRLKDPARSLVWSCMCRFVWAYVLPAGSDKIQSHIARLPGTVPLHCALAVFGNFIWCIDMNCLVRLSLFSIVILKEASVKVMAWFQSLTSSLLDMLDPLRKATAKAWGTLMRCRLPTWSDGCGSAAIQPSN